MANTLQIKRGTDLSNAGTPAAGEPVWNSSTSKLYIGDGSTAASSLSQVGSEFLPLAGGTLTGGLSGTTAILSSQLILPNGIAGTPAIRFADGDSGVYASANGEVAISTNGTQRLKIDDSTATFAGTVQANSGSKITSASTDTTFSIETTSGTSIFPVLDFVSSHSSVGGIIKQDGNNFITIDNSQNATFAGNITGKVGYLEAPSGLALNLDTASSSQNCWVTWNDNGTPKWEIGKNTAQKFYIHNYAGNESALVFDTSSNATFAGMVTSVANGFKTELSAGNAKKTWLAYDGIYVAGDQHLYLSAPSGYGLRFYPDGTHHWNMTSNYMNGNATGSPKLYNVGGSTATPAYAFNDDSNTGMLRGGNGIVVLCGVGSEVARFDGNNDATKFTGNVSIGTTETGKPLYINKAVASNTTEEFIYLDMEQTSHTVSCGASIVWRDINVYSDCLSIEGVRDGNGGSSRCYIRLREESTAQFEIQSNNTVSVAGSSVHTSSDLTLKKNISTLSGSLDKVNQMRGVQFKWKKDDDPHDEGTVNHQRNTFGFIAQEVEEILPEVVNTHPDSGLKSIQDANQITAVLVEAIKELSAKVEALENA